MSAVWVVLLRGINVGGHRKVPMADLRDAYRGAGCHPVLTYIQSGNVVVGADEGDPASLGLRLRAALAERSGVDAAVLVRSAAEWRELVAAAPFAGVDGDQLHLSLLDTTPTAEVAAKVAAAAKAPEQVRLIERAAYWCLPAGVAAARKLLTGADRQLGPTTMRNWRTVLRISAMVDEAEALLAESPG